MNRGKLTVPEAEEIKRGKTKSIWWVLIGIIVIILIIILYIAIRRKR